MGKEFTALVTLKCAIWPRLLSVSLHSDVFMLINLCYIVQYFRYYFIINKKKSYLLFPNQVTSVQLQSVCDSIWSKRLQFSCKIFSNFNGLPDECELLKDVLTL